MEGFLCDFAAPFADDYEWSRDTSQPDYILTFRDVRCCHLPSRYRNLQWVSLWYGDTRGAVCLQGQSFMIPHPRFGLIPKKLFSVIIRCGNGKFSWRMSSFERNTTHSSAYMICIITVYLGFQLCKDVWLRTVHSPRGHPTRDYPFLTEKSDFQTIPCKKV